MLVSQSKLSGIIKDTLKYILSEMNFDFEISRVDCRKQKYYFSVYSVDNPLTNTRRSSYKRHHKLKFFQQKLQIFSKKYFLLNHLSQYFMRYIVKQPTLVVGQLFGRLLLNFPSNSFICCFGYLNFLKDYK